MMALAAPADAATSDPAAFTRAVAKAAGAKVKSVTGETPAWDQFSGSIGAKVPGMKSVVDVQGSAIELKFGTSLGQKGWKVLATAIDRQLRNRGLTRVAVGTSGASVYVGNGWVCNTVSYYTLGCTTTKKASAVIKTHKPLLQKLHQARGRLYGVERVYSKSTSASSYKGYATLELGVRPLGDPNVRQTKVLYYKTPTQGWRFVWAGKADYPPCTKVYWSTKAKYKAFYGSTCRSGDYTYIVGAGA